MLRVSIIGCGKIADSHAEQIRRINDCEIVGVCDREELMARQLAERFSTKMFFSDIHDLLDKARPDVVHITTPPQSHFELGRLCLDRGCHIYVEKPFTLDTAQALELIRMAERRGLKVTVGHDGQFSHAANRLRELVGQGYLGGDPVHMESYYCYDLGRGSYANAMLRDKNHWVRRLPGKLLHNTIAHGIARIAEHLKSDAPTVIAYGFISPALQERGEQEIIDELRVIIAERGGATAYFTFSAQMRPSLHQFRIFGPRNGLFLDEDEQVVLRLRGGRFKSYAEKFGPPLVYTRQYLGNLARNTRLFLANDFHMKSGMKNLIEAFYRSITQNSPLPIAYREILLTSRICDDIFQQLNGNRCESDGNESPQLRGRPPENSIASSHI